jgi:phospholipid/cholesterol/gamma-HCH transport system ATP-binding protein
LTSFPDQIPAKAPAATVVSFDNVSLAFDDHVVLQNVSFTVRKGAMRILLGASGSGKSLILKLVLGLLRPDSGTIIVNGHRVDTMPEDDLLGIRADIGMLFQETALFDSLTVAENVGYRLYAESDMPGDEADRRVAEVLGFVGLSEYGDRMPSQLSGGQKRRVAIARAMASRPGLLLFDDPTVGLDPVISTTIDDEVIKLRDLEHVTSMLVTHQIRDAYYVATHAAVLKGDQLEFVDVGDDQGARADFMVLHNGGIRFEGTPAELLASKDPFLRDFLSQTLPPW